MPARIPHQKTAEPDRGVSEIIGAILLISLVILAVSIVGMFLLSATPTQKLPSVSFMTGNDNSGNLYLFHNGGDSLTLGTFSVVVDGISKTATIVEGGTDWSLGKTLKVPGIDSGSTHTVALVYNGTSGGPVILRSGKSSLSVPSNPLINPDISSYPPMVSVPQLMQNVTGASINYYREGGTVIRYSSPGGYIQFNVTKKNSALWYSNASPPTKMYALNIGSRIIITPFTVATSTYSPSMSVFGIGDQIWELTAENATVTVINQTGDNTAYNLGGGKPITVNNSWITGYSDFQSTLSLTTLSTPGTYYTELVVNNYPSEAASQEFTQKINQTGNTSTIVFSNIRPMGSGMFALRYDNRTQSTYFVGNASYTIT